MLDLGLHFAANKINETFYKSTLIDNQLLRTSNLFRLNIHIDLHLLIVIYLLVIYVFSLNI